MTTKIDDKIAALEEALGLGELSVEVDGKQIKYRSISELTKALAYFRRIKAQETGGRSVRCAIGSYAS